MPQVKNEACRSNYLTDIKLDHYYRSIWANHEALKKITKIWPQKVRIPVSIPKPFQISSLGYLGLLSSLRFPYKNMELQQVNWYPSQISTAEDFFHNKISKCVVAQRYETQILQVSRLHEITIRVYINIVRPWHVWPCVHF